MIKVEIHVAGYDPDGSELEKARTVAQKLSKDIDAKVSILKELGNIIIPVTDFRFGRELQA